MSVLLQPWQILLAFHSGLVNERQQQVIEFQNAQIQVLMKQFGWKRLLQSDDQRCLLAVKALAIGRKALLQLTTIFTPDTILRWHRELVARKFDSSDKRQPGRPRLRQEVVDAIIRFARENPTWGYDRIQGALANIGYDIADSTVANVLKAVRVIARQADCIESCTHCRNHRRRSWYPVRVLTSLMVGRTNDRAGVGSGPQYGPFEDQFNRNFADPLGSVDQLRFSRASGACQCHLFGSQPWRTPC